MAGTSSDFSSVAILRRTSRAASRSVGVSWADSGTAARIRIQTAILRIIGDLNMLCCSVPDEKTRCCSIGASDSSTPARRPKRGPFHSSPGQFGKLRRRYRRRKPRHRRHPDCAPIQSVPVNWRRARRNNGSRRLARALARDKAVLFSARSRPLNERIDDDLAKRHRPTIALQQNRPRIRLRWCPARYPLDHRCSAGRSPGCRSRITVTCRPTSRTESVCQSPASRAALTIGAMRPMIAPLL